MAPRQLNRLNAAFVTKTKTTGFHNDGAGLYLQVAPGKTGVTKSFVFRYKLHGGEHWMGLGATHTIDLAEAREEARLARQLILKGVDPIKHRNDRRSAAKAEQLKRLSFREAAAHFIEDNASSWRSTVHSKQWHSSLRDHALPTLGDLQVSDIEIPHVVRVLRPIWLTKPVTADRVRNRIERILNWTIANGNRNAGDNPASWERLQHILPRQQKAEAEHHAALPYASLPSLFAKLIKVESLQARALETLILTSVRIGDLLGARAAEFNLAEAVWTIPAHTRNGDGRATKSGKEFRAPLTPRLVALLQTLPYNPSGLVFSCGRTTIRDLLRRLTPDGVTSSLHGFRAAFRSWAHDHKPTERDFAEQALGHRLGSKVERTYQRSDAFDRRKQLMRDWEQFCLSGA
jgi:integrase